jgi:hypothetical protein
MREVWSAIDTKWVLRCAGVVAFNGTILSNSTYGCVGTGYGPVGKWMIWADVRLAPERSSKASRGFWVPLISIAASILALCSHLVMYSSDDPAVSAWALEKAVQLTSQDSGADEAASEAAPQSAHATRQGELAPALVADSPTVSASVHHGETERPAAPKLRKCLAAMYGTMILCFMLDIIISITLVMEMVETVDAIALNVWTDPFVVAWCLLSGCLKALAVAGLKWLPFINAFSMVRT